MIARGFQFMLSYFEYQISELSRYTANDFYKFNDKYSVVSKFPFFQRAISTIYAIHEFGANKYSYYSWQNTPGQSDSYLENSLDAIKRHLLLYRTGQMIDESGIHHIGHICCRAGSMALTRYYRIMMKNQDTQKTKTRESTFKYLNSVKQESCTDVKILPLMLDQISPETYISILKFKTDLIPTNVEECVDLIEECLHRCLFYPQLTEFNPYNDICYLDMIFWCATFILNTLPEIDDQCLTYLSSIATNQTKTQPSEQSGLLTSSHPA